MRRAPVAADTKNAGRTARAARVRSIPMSTRPRSRAAARRRHLPASSSGGCVIPNTWRRYARYALSSHMLLPGESDSFATGWPLQRTILMTICNGW